MNKTVNYAMNGNGPIIAISLLQDPEDNKDVKNNEPEYQNPYYDPDSDQGSQEYDPKEDPLKDDNEPIGEDKRLISLINRNMI